MGEIGWLIAIAGLLWLSFRLLRGSAPRQPSNQSRPRIPRAYNVQVVGESHYQDALETICGGRTPDGANQELTAVLVLDDSNPYDGNAVRVDIEGETVGYLSRDAAPVWRKHAAANALGRTYRCAALICGGWDRGGTDQGHFGVRLKLPS